MTVADRCPRCGESHPTEGGAATSEIREVQSGGIVYREETLRCSCGCIVGSFADPINV